MAQSSQTRQHFGIIELADNLHLGAAGDGFDVKFDGTNTLNIDPANANDILRVGETVLCDVHIDGLTDLIWDSSAGSLKNGAGFVPVILDAAQQVIAAGAGGAISIATYSTQVSTDGDADAFTLADCDGAPGTLKEIVLDVDGGGNAVVTVASLVGGTTVTLADAGDRALLMWNGAAWRVIGGRGVAIA